MKPRTPSVSERYPVTPKALGPRKHSASHAWYRGLPNNRRVIALEKAKEERG